MYDQTKLYYADINGRRITALPFVLEALIKVSQEAKELGLDALGKTGLVFQAEQTCSWRSEATQRQLVNKGVSWTMTSNHMRGTAIDLYWGLDYLAKIAPIMAKYGFVNDLAKYGDAGHFNWGSNTKAARYPIIWDQALITEFSMNQYEGNIILDAESSGSFALVKNGVKRAVSEKRAGLASLMMEAMGGTVVPVPTAVWDSIPDGEKF